jgi:hypothetical protein
MAVRVFTVLAFSQPFCGERRAVQPRQVYITGTVRHGFSGPIFPQSHLYFRGDETMCSQTVATLEIDDLRQIRGCQRLSANTAEVVLYQMRHIQHHAAQLNLLLRQTTDSAPGWVRRTNISPQRGST